MFPHFYKKKYFKSQQVQANYIGKYLLDTFWRDYSTTNYSFMLSLSLSGYKASVQKTSLKKTQLLIIQSSGTE